MKSSKTILSIDDIKLIEKRFRKIFATKNDLKRFATKKELKSFATKDDLKDAIDNLLEYINGNFTNKDEFKELREQIKNLPTKEEFFASV